MFEQRHYTSAVFRHIKHYHFADGDHIFQQSVVSPQFLPLPPLGPNPNMITKPISASKAIFPHKSLHETTQAPFLSPQFPHQHSLPPTSRKANAIATSPINPTNFSSTTIYNPLRKTPAAENRPFYRSDWKSNLTPGHLLPITEPKAQSITHAFTPLGSPLAITFNPSTINQSSWQYASNSTIHRALHSPRNPIIPPKSSGTPMPIPLPPATALTSGSNVFAPLSSPLAITFNPSTINQSSWQYASNTTTHRGLHFPQNPIIPPKSSGTPMSIPLLPATALTSSSNVFAPPGSPLVNTFNRLK
ncbi:MAG: hypothetical protein AAGN35_25600 [Bacteroidota bacterium]